jgi:uncharacterized protein YegL
MTTNLTEIIFLLDRSGSMAGLEKETVGGFNAFIEKQSRQDRETRLTTVLFDDEYEVLHNGVLINQVKLTEKDYYVRGATALLDAVGKTIVEVDHRLTRADEQTNPKKVIFVITTDGMENASVEFNYEKVKSLIQRQQTNNNWEFIFLGANMDAVKEANHLGIERENAFNFEASNVGVEEMYFRVNEVVEEKRKL